MALMDNSNPWGPDNEKFAYARNSAKIRVARCWNSWIYNMWTTYHTELNSQWVDPWFEHELSGVTNDPPTGDPSTDLSGYQMLQNLYCSYCWFKFNGYSKYAMIGMMTGFTHESTVTGGSWEARTYPYATLTSFDPTNTADPLSDSSTQLWYHEGQMIPAYSASARDEVTEITYTKSAPAGNLLGARQYPLKTYQVWVDVIDPDTGDPVIDPDTGLPVQVQKTRVTLDENGQPLWDTDNPTGWMRGAGTGYGIIQFTPFTKLPRICAVAALDNGYPEHNDFVEANRHWQLNLTLQYMMFEYQRYCAMNKDQSAQGYVGEWTDGSAVHAGFEYNGIRYEYNEPVTWDQFASDAFITKTNNLINQLGITGEDADWCRRHTAMDIWRACYVHTPYNDYNFQVISNYVKAAIEYWESLDDPNYYMDIPRARDIPNCRLDYYQFSPKTGPAIIESTKRRKLFRNYFEV